MPFPDKDDNTAAYPTYLPVLELVAWNISTSTSSVNDEQKPQTVGYAFLAPRRKTTTGDASTMERFLYPDYSDMHVGSSLFTMLLMLVQSECGIGVFGWVVTEASGYVQYLRHANRVRRVVAAVSIDTDASEGGEWLPRWLESKGFWEARRVRNLAVEMVRVKGVSEGGQGNQSSQTSVSSAENDQGSNDKQEDSEEEEEDWDDYDNP